MPQATTLAVGDGANDVNMITAAHIGVGVKGVEGNQAARASDYVIGEFKILRPLLLYHGRECFRRNSNLVSYNFYKNLVVVLPHFFYSFYNGFSATSLYDPWLY
jgi:phospholipid-transporting ATPase